MMKKNKYIILSEKKWNSNLKNRLELIFPNDEWKIINRKEDFKIIHLNEYKPSKIFIPHWSYLIPSDIYQNFECIVFHMTDLPFGRGGSPLQNLIVRGFKKTKISALKVEQGIDAGAIYLKKKLSLEGSAEKIFQRASSIVEEMIIEILKQDLKPLPQVGQITEFKRRKPEESNIELLNDLEKVYDYIRMLDCEGYPNAYVETSNLKFEFINANFNENEELITASVRISKK